MKLQEVPLELLQLVFSHVSQEDLSSLCRVSQFFNIRTMPDLYRDVVLDIRMGAKCPYVFGYTEKWTDGLRGLALNTHNQCQYVRSFTIMNSHPGRWFPRLPLDPSDYSDSIFDNGEYLSCSEKYPSLAFVSTLLEIALQNMLMLKEFTWTIGFCPSNSLLNALSKKSLSSFTFRYCEMSGGEAMNKCPSQPNLPIATSSPGLTSLCVMSIASNKAVDDMAALLFNNRKSLRCLQMGFSQWQWRRTYDIYASILFQRDGCAYEPCQWNEDQLLPILSEIVEEEEPMELHTLEIHRVSRMKASRWLKAFDFQSIRNFALIDTEIRELSAAEKLWRRLKGAGVSFDQLATDIHCSALLEFIGSFKGLETLLLCGADLSFSSGISDWLPALSGHFSTLRYLFIPPDEGWGGICNAVTTKTIVDGCPSLEEFGFAMREEQLDEILEALAESSSLTCIYVVTCLNRGSQNPLDSFDPRQFLNHFLEYYHLNPSPFFDRLERLSYSRALWELHPPDIDEEERGEMKYEFKEEEISEEEAKELHERRCDDLEFGENFKDSDEEGSEDSADDEDEEEEEGDKGEADREVEKPTEEKKPTEEESLAEEDEESTSEEEEEEDEEEEKEDDEDVVEESIYGAESVSHLLDQLHLESTEERAIFQFDRMPIRVKWHEHSDSAIVNAVRFYVMSDRWGVGLFNGDDPVFEECPCGEHEFDRSCWDGNEAVDSMRCTPRCPVLFPSSAQGC